MTKRGNASGGSGRTSSRRARRSGWLFARTAGAALSIAGSAHLASAQAFKLRVLDTPEGINATRVVAERISEDGETIGGFAVAADGQAYEVIWLLAPINNQAPGVYLREKVHFLTEYSNLEPTGSEVGGAQPNRQELPFSWTFASGHVLLPVPEGVTWGAAWDGNLVGEMVGYVDWETPQPLRWASITSMPEALTLAEGFTQGVAYGNNNVGDAVGLMGLPAAQDLRRPPRVEDDMSRNAGLVQPVLWPAAGPAVLLQERLVGVPDGLSLLGVHGINDARWMVGEALDRSPGRSRAVVYFPAQADATGDGVVDDGDLTVFLERLAARDPRSDVNSDGEFDHADAAQFLERFEARDAGGNLPTATLVPVSKALYTLSQGAFPDDDLTSALFGRRQRTIQEIHNPECYGCAGTHPRNPWAPHGAPGWPGDHPRNPYAPHGGAGGHGAPGGDGGPGGHGAPGGNGGRGGDGGKCGSGGDGGNGGVDGHGGSGGNGGLNGRGGNGGDGGPGSAGKPGGRGGAGGTGGRGLTPASRGANGGDGANGADGRAGSERGVPRNR